MPESTRRLTLNFLEWVSANPRTYAETMAAWRTTCPRLSVWEDALSDGLIRVEHGDQAHQARVTLTPHGQNVLTDHARKTAAR